MRLLRNFSIKFSTPSFTNENLNKFQYKLEGFDENWIETTSSSRAIQYTNLYAKNYIFKLKASNSGGIWSKISSYNIKVKPPLWFSYKGLALILFILGGLIYFGRRQIRLRLKLKKELLKMSVKKDKLERALGGIAEMKKVPDLVFIIDTNYESLAIAESSKLGIPICAILDSNSNPDGIDFPIPGNELKALVASSMT